MVHLLYCRTDLLFFDIRLLYYYVSLRLSIIFSRDMYLSLGISFSSLVFSASLLTVSELFCGIL